jgi:hypothetical protein
VAVIARAGGVPAGEEDIRVNIDCVMIAILIKWLSCKNCDIGNESLCRRHKKQKPSYWLKSTGRTYGGDKMHKCMNSMYVVRSSA